MSEKKITELGLAEFVAGLISETFEAISSSIEDQMRRHGDLESAADLPVADFGMQFVTPEQIEETAYQLFGSETNEHPVQAGALYIPATVKRIESPAFFDILGVELDQETHVAKTGTTFTLTEAGADFLYDRIREKLAIDQQTTLQNMLNAGIPKIVVDRGKILSKVTFNVTDGEETDDEEPPQASSAADARVAAAVSSLPIRKALETSRLTMLNRMGTTRSNLLLPGVKFKVKQADASSTTTSTTSVLGEVEIEFRTVS